MAEHTLKRAARLLDDWAKQAAHHALVNSTDPDKGVQLYAVVIRALAAKAHMQAREYEMSLHALEAAGQAGGPADD